MKKLIYIIFLLFFVYIFSVTATGAPYAAEFEEKIENEFYSSLDSEISSMLEENGLDALDSEVIFSKGTESIKNYFSETLLEKVRERGIWFFKVLSILMLLSVFSSAFDFSATADVFSLLSTVVLTLVTVDKIGLLINCVVSAVELNSKLMLCFVPVFTLIVSLSGNPSSALTYNSLVLLFSELMSSFVSNIFVSLIGAYFALSIAFSFYSGMNLNRFVNSVNRIVTFVLGFSASMFTGFLSLKNILAYSTDSLSVKGVKFLLSSMIPVIGPSLSDAYSTILGSIHLMKGSLGAVGIFAAVIINIPPLAEGAVYCFSLSVLSGIAEMLGLNRASETLRCFSGCVRILLLVSLFQLFILVISTGIMLTLKGV